MTQWRIIGTSVQGAAHLRTGKPNQDDFGWWPEAGEGLPLILVVADGHGSAKSFRSDIGAARAVQTARQTLHAFLTGQPNLVNLSTVKRTAEERLPQELVRQWKERVLADLQATPFSAQELEVLGREAGGREAVDKNPALAYGATLLSVLVTENFILYLQLGDGEILTVSASGMVERPLPVDERLFANQTTSLCSPEAWKDFRLGFQALSGAPPALILLTTDGYANSFRDDASFLKVGSDLLDIIRTEGLDYVDENLDAWLTEASQSGSGDDVTLGIVCHVAEPLPPTTPSAPSPPA